MTDSPNPLRESRRRAIFVALVAKQDGGMGVPESRAFVASRFDVSKAIVACIEREGLAAKWPPLDRATTAMRDNWLDRPIV